MAWEKMGLVYCPPPGGADWQASHAYLPTPVLRGNDVIRVYVAFLDPDMVGRVGYVDVDARDPRRVIGVSARPVLDIGEPGTFDDNGVTPVCVITVGDRPRLYYMGWELGVRVRYRIFVGIAESADGGETFARLARVPALERTDQEVLLRSASHVLPDQGVWRMWYVGGSKMIDVGGKEIPTYNLRYLESEDGLSWGGPGRVVLDPQGPDEIGFGRPFVCKLPAGGYEMWYSVRTRSRQYHLGYATSPDGLRWTRRDDQAGIEVSAQGWDSEMIAFGAVIDVESGRYMFYNGNDFGRTGFGVARWRGP